MAGNLLFHLFLRNKGSVLVNITILSVQLSPLYPLLYELPVATSPILLKLPLLELGIILGVSAS